MAGLSRPQTSGPAGIGCWLRTACAVFLFATSTLLFMRPFSWLYFAVGRPTERKRLRYHRWLCMAARTALRLLPGVTFRTDNREGEDFSRPAVIVCNHQSHLDLLCILTLTPRLVVLTNDRVWHNPYYGDIIRRAEFYPVSDGMERNTERLRDLARRGYSVVVFPEGTRSPDCRILRFHQGAFRLSAELGLEVLPVFLYGPGKVMAKESRLIRRGRLYMEIGKREAAPRPDDEAAVRQMRRAMHARYVAHYAELCDKLEQNNIEG